MKSLASDNYAGVLPEVMEALQKANMQHARSYGADDVTSRVRTLFKDIFEADSLFNNGNKELAASKINSLVDLNDQTPELIRIAAYKLESYKMYRKAEEIYKYILKINPSNINSYLDVANILIDQKKYNESYEVLKKSLDIIENTKFQINT